MDAVAALSVLRCRVVMTYDDVHMYDSCRRFKSRVYTSPQFWFQKKLKEHFLCIVYILRVT